MANWTTLKEAGAVTEAIVSVRIDGAIKEEAEEVLSALGLTAPDVVRLLLKRVAREKALPFDPLIPNAETAAAIEAARRGETEPVTLERVAVGDRCGRLGRPANCPGNHIKRRCNTLPLILRRPKGPQRMIQEAPKIVQGSIAAPGALGD